MKVAVIVLVGLLVLGGAAAIVYVTTEDDEPRFTEAQAEAAVTRALERCDHGLRNARVTCKDVGNGFACRADGRFVAGFDYPDPEDPEFEVSC